MLTKQSGSLMIFVLTGTVSASAGNSSDFRAASSAPSIATLVDDERDGSPSERHEDKKRPTVTPEPSSLLLIGTGMAGLAAGIWRKRNQRIK